MPAIVEIYSYIPISLNKDCFAIRVTYYFNNEWKRFQTTGLKLKTDLREIKLFIRKGTFTDEWSCQTGHAML